MTREVVVADDLLLQKGCRGESLFGERWASARRSREGASKGDKGDEGDPCKRKMMLTIADQ